MCQHRLFRILDRIKSFIIRFSPYWRQVWSFVRRNTTFIIYSNLQRKLFFHLLRPMQYKLNILPFILFSASSSSRQQTHSLRVGMISHRSQVHQNVPSNRSFTSSFSLSLSSGLGTRSGSKREDDLEYTLARTNSLELRDVTLSGLARPGR